jgi:hypothetical protein
MNTANEFLTPVPAAFYQSGVIGGAEWIWKRKEAAYNLRLYDAAPHSYLHAD